MSAVDAATVAHMADSTGKLAAMVFTATLCVDLVISCHYELPPDDRPDDRLPDRPLSVFSCLN